MTRERYSLILRVCTCVRTRTCTYYVRLFTATVSSDRRITSVMYRVHGRVRHIETTRGETLCRFARARTAGVE